MDVESRIASGLKEGKHLPVSKLEGDVFSVQAKGKRL
jgi:hypothetical protein